MVFFFEMRLMQFHSLIDGSEFTSFKQFGILETLGEKKSLL